MSYGTCKYCGCTDDNACVHPDLGACWWVDDEHEVCSHCAAFPDDTCVERPADREAMEKEKTTLTAYAAPGLKTVDDCIVEAFGITHEQLQDPKRIREAVDARKFAMWWQRDTYGKKKSFNEIGAMYAGKDHGVAMKAFKTDHHRQMSYPDYREKAERALELIETIKPLIHE